MKVLYFPLSLMVLVFWIIKQGCNKNVCNMSRCGTCLNEVSNEAYNNDKKLQDDHIIIT
jgi:hypothetical protein